MIDRAAVVIVLVSLRCTVVGILVVVGTMKAADSSGELNTIEEHKSTIVVFDMAIARTAMLTMMHRDQAPLEADSFLPKPVNLTMVLLLILCYIVLE